MKSPIQKRLAWVLLVALVVRLGVACYWHQRLEGGFLFGDSHGYWVLAQSIADGGPYQYGPNAQVFRTPGYPLLLSPLFLFGEQEPSAIWGRVLSCLFGTLAVGGVWWLGRQLFDDRAALAAAVVAALYPGAIATSVLILSEAPFCPLMLLQLVFWIIAWRASSTNGTVGWSMAAGAVAGLATLVRPSWLLFIPFALGVGLLVGPDRKRHLIVGSTMLIGLCLVMTPWWIRNARLVGHFIPTSLQVGASLYDGLNPDATGASNMAFVPPMVEAERQDPSGDPGDSFEYRLDRRIHAEAVSWAQANPGRVVQLAGIKFLRIWNFWPNEPSLSAWPVRLAVVATYLPVLILAVGGAVKTYRLGWPYVLCWLPAVYFTLLHVIFVSSIRYRQPALLSLIVLAAGVLLSRNKAGASSVPTAVRVQTLNPKP